MCCINYGQSKKNTLFDKQNTNLFFLLTIYVSQPVEAQSSNSTLSPMAESV